jgi:hypothetical protein
MSYTFEFGKYSGWAIEKVPTDYLVWLINSNAEKKRIFEAELQRRKEAEEQARRAAERQQYEDELRRTTFDPEMAKRVIQAGFRAVAQQCHPDHGGNTADMQNLNLTVEKLRKVFEDKAKEDFPFWLL